MCHRTNGPFANERLRREEERSEWKRCNRYVRRRSFIFMCYGFFCRFFFCIPQPEISCIRRSAEPYTALCKHTAHTRWGNFITMYLYIYNTNVVMLPHASGWVAAATNFFPISNNWVVEIRLIRNDGNWRSYFFSVAIFTQQRTRFWANQYWVLIREMRQRYDAIRYDDTRLMQLGLPIFSLRFGACISIEWRVNVGLIWI